MTVMGRLQQFLRRESSAVRMGYGLAIAGHVIITLLLIFGAFERIVPASAVVAIPVGIVMEKPNAQAPPPPDSAPNEQNNPPPSLPPVADVEKRAKAPVAKLNVNGADQPKQPGHDGGDPNSGPVGVPQPPADGEAAAGAAAAASEATNLAPVGPAPPQTTASEPGEDELTAIKEEKLECGLKAKLLSPTETNRYQAKVVEFATEAQGLALIRTSQLVLDRHMNPHYLKSQQVIVETLRGAHKLAVVLPAGFAVNEGDVIEFDLGYVNPSDPCHYIPNIAVSKR
ncbi:hypothetical protein [Bradyrhizobium sp.]|uniref:hypothetical protein n=1 Tax=Bradyrhizobium sp. TaxID=376 RepID=UPI002638295E|nr:hypothetical protein [Bradyrhizobium sp.]